MAAFAAKGKKLFFTPGIFFLIENLAIFFPETDALAICEKWMLAINYQEIGLSLMFTQSAYVSLKIFFLINPIFFKVFKVFICRLFSDVLL